MYKLTRLMTTYRTTKDLFSGDYALRLDCVNGTVELTNIDKPMFEHNLERRFYRVTVEEIPFEEFDKGGGE